MASIFKQQAGEGGDISFNMTPMIDCTFQLIIFFILASQMVNQSLAKLELPRPTESQVYDADELKILSRITVNVVSAAGDNTEADPATAATAQHYQIDDGTVVRVGDIERLKRILEARLNESKKEGVKASDFYVVVRADKRVNYSYVVPVMKAAGDVGIEKMNLTALK